ncbi:Nuclear hormone receptor family member nhr-66 [Caenorhabditis elegans]|nr:Nuclear hormone receptor family member nhr-66 [Caenorhabditis elegans]CCD63565.1 Nuclear hormone receptor family member nhr-66 [Caenorhabditis elegans]|eukprot:NP_001023369.1 Nuclear Hormone Receptor family [Caenorhabditis elegans]
MTPQIGLTGLGSLTSLPPELLLQFARLDGFNLLPAVGSPAIPSSSSCSEPSTSQASTVVSAPTLPPPSPLTSLPQKPAPLMPSGHVTTVDQQNRQQHQQQQRQQQQAQQQNSMARKYSMDTIQHHTMQHPHQLQYIPNHFMTASTDVFAAMDMSQKQSSPPGIFKIVAAKNEPSSSSNSQPGTPAMGDRRAVPACAICGTDSTGIHFGVDACAACSAFFRRTVVLNKDYSCNKGGKCTVVKDGSAGQKCRACRFRKCISSGMDKNSVQHRRDAIGKYSAGVKRELSPDAEFEPSAKVSTVSEPSTSSGPSGGFNQNVSSPAGIPRVPSTLRTTQASTCMNSACGQKSVLHELICRQNFLTEQRQLFYAGCLGDWFRKPSSIENQTLSELTDFSSCMFHLWKIEPRLAADFMNRNRYLDPLPIVEKLKIYRNFVIMRQSVEEPYLTWRHGGLEKRWFVMPNNTYIDFNNIAKYFENGALKDLKLDYETTTNLFLPSFTHAMDTIGEKMKKNNITETELTILLGLVLLDPGIYGIHESTRKFLKRIRDQLIHDVYMYYEDEMSHLYDPEIRMADIFMLVAAIKIHSIKTSENMHMLRVFDLIPADACFNQMLDVESVNVSPDGQKDSEAEQGPSPVSVPEAARGSYQDDDMPPVLEKNCDL